jgi:uncharacterized membrane protein HdeD (DUF308 family)
MFEELSRVWWAFLARGVLAMLFGILALAWPAITLAVFVVVFGAYAFIDGIFLVIKAINIWSAKGDHWLLMLEGLIGVGVGTITFAAPAVSAIVLLFYIAAWSLATGFMEIAQAVRLRKEIQREMWLMLSGIVSIFFAVILMLFPSAGALGVIWLVFIYAILFGLLLVVFSFRLFGHGGRANAALSK